MLTECENVSQRMQTAAMQHTPFYLPLYYPFLPSELNRLTDSFILNTGIEISKNIQEGWSLRNV